MNFSIVNYYCYLNSLEKENTSDISIITVLNTVTKEDGTSFVLRISFKIIRINIK